MYFGSAVWKNNLRPSLSRLYSGQVSAFVRLMGDAMTSRAPKISPLSVLVGHGGVEQVRVDEALRGGEVVPVAGEHGQVGQRGGSGVIFAGDVDPPHAVEGLPGQPAQPAPRPVAHALRDRQR